MELALIAQRFLSVPEHPLAQRKRSTVCNYFIARSSAGIRCVLALRAGLMMIWTAYGIKSVSTRTSH